MKILILGPVQSDKYFGGVATFTESLADAMVELGHETEILTDYTIKATTLKGAKISAVSKKPQRRNMLLPYLVNRALNKRNSDLIISSLEYGLALVLPHKNNAKKIHYLHAFPALTMAGFLKTKALNISMKLIASKVDYMISNSSLTSVINKEIYGIRVDDMISIGLDSTFESFESLDIKKDSKLVLYAGRLASEKNIYKLLDAIKILRKLDPAYTFKIAGAGPEYDSLMRINLNDELKIDFLGVLEKEALVSEYARSAIFISLNPHEPFGLTYLEAIKSKCKIVCPYSGGQLDIARFFPENFTYVNPYSGESIALGIVEASQQNADMNNNVEDYFSYKILAGKLIEKCS